MAKNIILCADGTGNKGGSTPDSNVYKMYNAVSKHFKGKTQDGFEVDEQIIFYDNGVGTDKNPYLRMLGGAFGFGFEDNVCDMYKYLARNYEPGDRIYFFGFSRGASTVRACNGFINICGLAKGKGLRNREMEKLAQKTFRAYKAHKNKPEKAEKLKKSEESHGAIDIHFMGIWDTVVALGFPKRTDITGPLSGMVDKLFWLLDRGSDWFCPHSFYHYKLTENVKQAYQALSIDDERTAFWPFVWREDGREAGTVEQVWFAGMHSNVGGGYARSGMANVPLYWMMLRAEKRGLKLDNDAVQKASADSHVHGRMYNSRNAFAAFYRYHPREIEKLCESRLQGDIRIHRSVIERINHRTANYTPGQLPGRFVVVENDTEASPQRRNPAKDPKWRALRDEIDQWVKRRKILYASMIIFVVTILSAATTCWLKDFVPKGYEFSGFIAKPLAYVLPSFFEDLIYVAVEQSLNLFLIAAVVVFVYLSVRGWCHDKTTDACERLRHLIIHEEIEDDN